MGNLIIEASKSLIVWLRCNKMPFWQKCRILKRFLLL